MNLSKTNWKIKNFLNLIKVTNNNSNNNTSEIKEQNKSAYLPLPFNSALKGRVSGTGDEKEMSTCMWIRRE